MPNMYARGILWGKMFLELGDSCTAKNEQTGHYADIQFKTKGYFSGSYNAIQGKIRRGNTETGEISGKWSAVMEYKSSKVRGRRVRRDIKLISFRACVQGERRVLFDAAKDGQNIAPKWVAPEDEQEEYESRR